MRNLAEFALGPNKVTLMHWNNKYVVRVERGPLEQVYKLDAVDFVSAEDLRAKLDEAFGARCDSTFQTMRETQQSLWS